MTSTIDQVFQARGLWRWYASTVTNGYDGVSEKGQDYSTTFGTPVAVPVGGQIKRIVHNNNSIGDVVEMQTADGSVWLYQHITAIVKVNAVLLCGDVIGTENGMPVDQYSTGPHIEVRYAAPGTWSINIDSWVEPWINPRAIFGSIGSQQAGTTGVPGIGIPYGQYDPTTGTNPTGQKPPLVIHLAPNADVKALLQIMDIALDVVNPFDIQNVQQDSILGATFTDPFSWIEGFGNNLIIDLRGLILRALLLLLGVFIIKRITGDFLDYDGLQENLKTIPQKVGSLLK